MILYSVSLFISVSEKPSFIFCIRTVKVSIRWYLLFSITLTLMLMSFAWNFALWCRSALSRPHVKLAYTLVLPFSFCPELLKLFHHQSSLLSCRLLSAHIILCWHDAFVRRIYVILNHIVKTSIILTICFLLFLWRCWLFINDHELFRHYNNDVS